MQETRWHIIRHAPVDNPEGRIYGASDRMANVSNTKAFKVLAERLPQNAVSVVSHLKRTHQTLNAIKEAGLKFQKPIIDHRLGEQDFGDWVGKTYDEARAAYGKSYSRFWLAPVSEKPSNGESFIELMGRVHKSINEINARFLNKDIICVAHGGSIRAALALALGIKAEQAIPFTINNLSTTLIDYIHPEDGFKGAWRVRGANIPAI